MSMETVTTNLKYQLGEIGKAWSPGSIATRNGWLNKLIPQLEDEYDAPNLTILRNEHLNSAGKLAATRALGEKFLLTVSWLKNLATKHEGEDQGFRVRLFAVNSPIKDELRRDVRSAYLWTKFARLDQRDRDLAFLKAAEEDRLDVLWAMVDAPDGPMVSDEMRQRALGLRAQRQQPNDYAGFQQNTLLLEYAHMLQELIGRRLYSIGVDAAKIKTVLGVTVASDDERPSVTPEQFVAAK